MPKHGKNFRNASKDLKPLDRFSVEDAVAKTVAASFAKFDETVDVAMRLGVDPKYSDQMVRGAVPLPNGLGKTVRVAVFCKGEKQAEAREAGADFVGSGLCRSVSAGEDAKQFVFLFTFFVKSA